MKKTILLLVFIMAVKVQAQDIQDSPYLKRVAEEARKRRIYICFGFTSLENGKVYNTTGLWNKSGELVGIYHKTHLQTHDLQYEKGEGLPVFDTDWGKVGVMICDIDISKAKNDNHIRDRRPDIYFK